MKNKEPKLIILYGFAGIGKTTLAKKLSNDMPLSLCIEADELLTMIGQWLPNEEQARKYVYAMTKSLIKTYLKLNKDVIIPYLLTNKVHAEEFQKIAESQGAEFLEIYIKSGKEECVRFLLERGTWGEKGAPSIKKSDLPHIENICSEMEEVMESRENCIEIPYFRDDVERTYDELKKLMLVR